MSSTQIVLGSEWFLSINLWYPTVEITTNYRIILRDLDLDLLVFSKHRAPRLVTPRANSECRWLITNHRMPHTDAEGRVPKLSFTLRSDTYFQGLGLGLIDVVLFHMTSFLGLSAKTKQKSPIATRHTLMAKVREPIINHQSSVTEGRALRFNHKSTIIKHWGPGSKS